MNITEKVSEQTSLIAILTAFIFVAGIFAKISVVELMYAMIFFIIIVFLSLMVWEAFK